jgi:FkbM family methyltransferase
MRNGLSIHVGGFDVNASVEHRHYLDALRNDEVESFMAKLFSSVIRPGMVVLDIGAFVGWYTLLAARQVRPWGKVYAFEPDPRNGAWLSDNIGQNGVGDRVVLVPKAVSNRAEAASFFLHGGDQSRSSLIPSALEAETTVVSTVVLDTFFANSVKVDVVKIDIEGAELRALEGMTETLSRASKGLKLFVECNPSWLRLAGESAQSLTNRLQEVGFTISLIDESNRSLKPVDSSVETAKYVNLYCVRKN